MKIFKNVVLCLPHKRLKVAKKELDSENESALGGQGENSHLVAQLRKSEARNRVGKKFCLLPS
ncbi:hypothetical protein [Microcystis sp.]|uniref:hypothetical protein n=1 Tax=Microcystis sp. TaxID=1127 RepID=UPI00391A5344